MYHLEGKGNFQSFPMKALHPSRNQYEDFTNHKYINSNYLFSDWENDQQVILGTLLTHNELDLSQDSIYYLPCIYPSCNTAVMELLVPDSLCLRILELLEYSSFHMV